MTSKSRDSSDGGSGPARVPEEFARWAADDAGAPGLDLDKLQAELEGKLAQERGPAAWLRSRSTPVRGIFGGGAVALLVVATMAIWLRPDFEVYPAGRMLALLALLAGMIIVDLILVLWPLQLPAAPRWLSQAAVIAAPLGLLVLYALPAAHVDHPRSLQAEGLGPMLVSALRCLLVGSGVAAGMYAVLRGLDRGGAPRLLLMAACAGLSANLMLQLHCPKTAPLHLLLGHLGVVGLCFGAAWLLGRER
ncbi:MAG TPA: hypothetical protein VJV78_49390 [Polyangiales bacterium]|nr:hypothetical protein [Polyangiales bacterium]